MVSKKKEADTKTKKSTFKPWEGRGKKKVKEPPPPLPQQPTLNLTYNALLVVFQQKGVDARPSCDGCDTDLTGKRVHDTSTGWLCDDCKEAAPPDCKQIAPRPPLARRNATIPRQVEVA